MRLIAKHLQMPIWDKPASPCLSSRFPYGTAITNERLKQVDTVESFLYATGFRIFRARYYGDAVELELGKDELQKIQDESLKSGIRQTCLKAGFKEMSINPTEFRSGSLNTHLA